ncbi:lipoprotein [Actinorhabdospora filicis]|uniref:Lipoprotein n=1 Tax=Actinorhabdospora filicis TaxID=1785913 RepID=A0A9W6SHV2_9ACTN|nr:SCO0930 family lipoprotein [Actinorhabdospora filicis]GLZ76273.1 lipoprotein [Actinorhabdospora filicis]
MRKPLIAIAAAALLLGLAACGTAKAPDTTPAGNEKAADALATVTDPVLGDLVVDDEGYVLYRFDADASEPPKSNCSGECAVKWPPSPAVDAAKLTGIDPAILGSFTREDGSKQAMLSNYLLYRFAGDSAPGQTNGQGVGGKWWAVKPDGKRAGKAPAANGPLKTIDDPRLGTIVVDSEGFVLYRHKGDTDDPMASTCNGECAAAWPPVGEISTDASGVKARITSFKRADGTVQSSLDCWPLYRFAKDTKPGEVTGHGGANGTFFAVTPDGKFANGGKPL